METDPEPIRPFMEIVTEGRVRMLACLVNDTAGEPGGVTAPAWKERDCPTKSMPVFYNPEMKLNRDISVLAVAAWAELHGNELKIADVMCGGGVRGLRYLCESTEGQANVDFIDLNPAAIKTCKENVLLNGLDPSRHGFHALDANDFLHATKRPSSERYDVIDLDPFGNPMAYVQGTVKAARREGTLLQINATDLAVLSGPHKRAAQRKYGVVPLRDVSYHAELAIRMLLSSVFARVSSLDATIKPMISIAHKHFIKVVCEVTRGAGPAERDMKWIGHVVHCKACRNGYKIPLDALRGHVNCKTCGSTDIKAGGPYWIGPVQDKAFCERLQVLYLDRKRELKGKTLPRVLDECIQEATMPPCSIDLHEVSKELGIGTVGSSPVIEGLRNEGYVASRVQSSPTAIKTTATRESVASIMARLSKDEGGNHRDY